MSSYIRDVPRAPTLRSVFLSDRVLCSYRARASTTITSSSSTEGASGESTINTSLYCDSDVPVAVAPFNVLGRAGEKKLSESRIEFPS